MLTPEEKAEYDKNGFLIARNLFRADEVEFYKQHFMQMREEGEHPGDFALEVQLRKTRHRTPRFSNSDGTHERRS